VTSAKRIAAAALLGGTTSALTGGKFANGAITGAFSRAFNEEAKHRNHERSSSRKTLKEATDAAIQEGKGLRNSINRGGYGIDDFFETEGIGAFVFEHSERDGLFGSLTTDYIFGTSINATTFLEDDLWGILLGSGNYSNGDGSVGTIGFFGDTPRSDVRAIVINSANSPASSRGLGRLSRFFNTAPVYNTIGNTTYVVQDSSESGVTTCSVYSGTNGGYCN
jgi:hypothetical protein